MQIKNAPHKQGRGKAKQVLKENKKNLLIKERQWII